MDIKLCNNASETNIINKRITEVHTVSGATIKGNLSYENPVIVLAYNSSIAANINYMKIAELNRCYFITDIINLTGGRYEIHGKVDVLESFKTQILQLNAIIDKQSILTNSNLYLDDGSWINENKEFNSVINFPNGFNADGEYILVTAGGGGGII